MLLTLFAKLLLNYHVNEKETKISKTAKRVDSMMPKQFKKIICAQFRRSLATISTATNFQMNTRNNNEVKKREGAIRPPRPSESQK